MGKIYRAEVRISESIRSDPETGRSSVDDAAAGDADDHQRSSHPRVRNDSELGRE